MKITTATTKVS